jgi:large subunit ribosomal protein L1
MRAARAALGSPEELRSLEDAVALLKKIASVRFDETVDIAVNLGVDPRHADQMVRGVVNLPKGAGRTVKVAVFARGVKAEEALEAGADRVGAEDLVSDIQKGIIDFNVVIATPDVMPLVGRVGKILGPRGLMPNPKVETVTMDVAKAVRDVKGGKIQFRVDKTGILHSFVGKVSFSPEDLIENIRSFVGVVRQVKPKTSKGVYIKRIALSSTMGPGIRVQIDSI